jgi:4-phosphopantoate---beta-alanine ligase
MTRISPSHPRYRSLVTRARLATELRAGLVVPEGLIAQGRAEAFDYFLGERTTLSARRAIRRAAEWLVAARAPVISVNGNVAALAAGQVARLAKALPGLQVEVNLFHRTPGRAREVARRLRDAGVAQVLGVRPTGRIPGLPSDRGKVDPRGIGRADVVVVPLEDGDRTEALKRLGKRVISIDLNPLSRTSEAADLPIVDELQRALERLTREVRAARRRTGPALFVTFDADAARSEALEAISRRLAAAAGRRRLPAGPSRTARRRARLRRKGTGRRTRRTP